MCKHKMTKIQRIIGLFFVVFTSAIIDKLLGMPDASITVGLVFGGGCWIIYTGE